MWPYTMRTPVHSFVPIYSDYDYAYALGLRSLYSPYSIVPPYCDPYALTYGRGSFAAGVGATLLGVAAAAFFGRAWMGGYGGWGWGCVF